MKLALTTSSFLFFAFSAVACGGSSQNVLGQPNAEQENDGGGAQDGGDIHSQPNPEADAGASPVGQDLSCGDEAVTSITGTWLLISSSPHGVQNTAQLVIDGTHFSFTANDKSLTFAANGDLTTLTWKDGNRTAPINSSHTNAALDVGLIPLALGGQWSFASPTSPDACTASASAETFNVSCNQVRATPLGLLDGTLVGQRVATASSLFGQLGGTWHVTSNRGYKIDATFNGNVFIADMIDLSGGDSPRTTLKFCKNALSGKTTSGVEISGTRS